LAFCKLLSLLNSIWTLAASDQSLGITYDLLGNCLHTKFNWNCKLAATQKWFTNKFPMTGKLLYCHTAEAVTKKPVIRTCNHLKTCIHIQEHTQEIPIQIHFIYFRQQGNLLYFRHILHNLYFIFHKMSFISKILSFSILKYIFHKPCHNI
jgi:hypothetical protein